MNKKADTYSILVTKRAEKIFEKNGLPFSVCTELMEKFSKEDDRYMISVVREK